MRLSWSAVPVARFAESGADWDALHAAMGGPAPLASAFVAPLLTQFARGEELLLQCRAGTRTLAMGVFTPSRAGAWTCFQPAQAPLGLWLQEPGCDTAVLLRALPAALPGFPLACSLTQLDPMLLPRPAERADLTTLDYIETARVTLAGDFETYWQARGKNLRNGLRKQRSRLERDGVATRLEIARTSGAMAQAVRDYGRLEGSGWKAGAGTAVSPDDAQGRYYRSMLEAMAARDAASVYRYYFDERLVAMDLCIEDRDSIVILKTAYDEGVPAGLSPALLMREEAMRALFESGRFARVEFYGRVMEWHTRWTAEVRTMYHINHYRWPALRRLHALLQARRRKASAQPTKNDHDVS